MDLERLFGGYKAGLTRAWGGILIWGKRLLHLVEAGSMYNNNKLLVPRQSIATFARSIARSIARKYLADLLTAQPCLREDVISDFTPC